MAWAKWHTVHQRAVCMQGSRAQDSPAIPFLLLSVHTHHTLPSSWRVYWGVTCSEGFNVVIPLPLPILSFPKSVCHRPVAGKAAH